MNHLSPVRNRWPDVYAAYQMTFPAVFRSPAVWLFAAVYILAAALYLPAGGSPAGFSERLLFLAFYLLVMLLVIPLTANAPAPAWEEQAEYSRNRLWWQMGVLLLFYLLSLLWSFLLFGPIGAFLSTQQNPARVLLTLSLIATLLLLLCVLPLVAMRLLGGRWSELGFGHGYHAFRVIAMSCLLPVGALVVLLLVGSRTLPGLVIAAGSSALQAGFPEEVFFRGLLLTRLIRLFGTTWGVVLSAWLFGLAHLATNSSHSGNLFIALCEMILTQAILGVTFAVIFLRTRNILAGVVFHTLLDTTGL